MELYELKIELSNFRYKLDNLKQILDVNSIKNELVDMKEKINKEDFWNNPQKASLFIKKYTYKKKIAENYDFIDLNLTDLIFLLKEMPDEIEEILIQYKMLKKKISQLEINSLLSGKYDNNSVYLEIHPGAGGVESHDFAEMLLNMYMRYFTNSQFDTTIIDLNKGEVAGIKSVLLKIEGETPFGLLKSETGIHRLIRISPFDSGKRRHTSFASVKVSPILENVDLKIDEKDLKIDTFRSTGAGGQSVNTTDSAVRIKHIPTGTVVNCQNERSQIQNKEIAMDILKSKLALLEELQIEKEQKEQTGELKSNAFGSQKRTYTMHPYKLVKDHASGYQTNQVDKVMSGDIEKFIYNNLLNHKRSDNE